MSTPQGPLHTTGFLLNFFQRVIITQYRQIQHNSLGYHLLIIINYYYYLKGGECDRIFTNYISLIFIIFISLISQLTKGEWSWKQVVTKYRIPLHGPCSMLKLTNPNITKRRCQIKWQTFFVTCELLMLNLIIISLTLISFHHCILNINL